MNKKLLVMAALLCAPMLFAQPQTNQLSQTINMDSVQRVTEQHMLDQVRILQYYVKECGGNEKLGKILYDKRYGRLPLRRDEVTWGSFDDLLYRLLIANYIIPMGNIPSEEDVKVFSPTRGIDIFHRYYPDGIWRITVIDEIKHIEGPLVGVVTAQHKKEDTKEYIELKLTLYNESGEEMYTMVRESSWKRVTSNMIQLYAGIYRSEGAAERHLRFGL